jgi:hypothetical protein
MIGTLAMSLGVHNELEQFSAVRHHLKHPSAGAGARLVGLFGSYA